MNTERYGITVIRLGLGYPNWPYAVECVRCGATESVSTVRIADNFEQAAGRAEDHLLLYHLNLVTLKDLQ